MNVIDYYRRFANIVFGNDFYDINGYNHNHWCFYNNYLYIMKDKLKGPVKITTFEDHFTYLDGHVSDDKSDKDIYTIFIPCNRYMLVLNADATDNENELYFYNNKQYVTTFISSDIKGIIDFLGIDKLTASFDFVVTTLQMMYDISLDIDTDQYISKYESLIERSIDCYLQTTKLSSVDEEHYSIRSLAVRESYLNMKDKEYTFGQVAEGSREGLIYGFEIDSSRSILIFADKYSDAITMCYYKDDKVMFNDISFLKLHSELKMMLILLNRRDMYEYLKMIRFFKREVFYSLNWLF